ncbi:hypothetical protein SLEP1_g33236 [Rubroshorea leprosula]|uniref:Uncharacterized protein n=1 Tax=Rubroshorea leprosula TaxID=152421 RepID=A0AAV5KG10_9ROSI|nr:hypothetical protein SLEP1_g33236 [Rubroshorea leprosula]
MMEMIVQFAIVVLAIASFFAVRYLPKKLFTSRRTNHRPSNQSRRHLAQATQLLARARSTSDRNKSEALAKTALTEAETALSLFPKDPAPYILKSLALDLLGHKRSALRSLDLALASPRVRSIQGRERVEALVRRAELKLAVNRKRRVDSAVADLEEAVRVSEGGGGGGGCGGVDARAFCVLGECYEFKGMKEEARRAFQEALKMDPECGVARRGLDRLG